MKLDINTDAVKGFTKTLGALHRSALPSAVRGALNKAVFDVKKFEMPRQAHKDFTNRQPNFFKANSKFINAKGFNISTMQAEVGFFSNSLKGANNYAVKDLEQQEEGGTINKKSFIPLKSARASNSINKLVRPNARLESIKKLVNSTQAKGKNYKERFVKSAVFTGKKGFLLHKNILWKINSVKRLDNGNTVFNKTPLYSFNPGRSVKIRQTRFMEKSAFNSSKKLEKFYVDEAQRQIKKYVK